MGNKVSEITENRDRVLRELHKAIREKEEWRGADGLLWRTVTLFAGEVFRTSGRGRAHIGAVDFSYEIKLSRRTGEPTDEIVISTRVKGKTITRSSVELALGNALSVQRAKGYVKGPRAMGEVFGRSYLYAMFLRWRLITDSIDVSLHQASDRRESAPGIRQV